MRDAGRVLTVVEGCDVVFHLAALIGIPYSYVAPESYVQTNVMGTQNVAAACRRAGVRPHGAHVDERDLRHRDRGADRRGPSAAAAIAVLGVEDRRRHDGAELPPRVRPPRGRRAPVQHLRPPPVAACGDPDHPRPAAPRDDRDPPRRDRPDAAISTSSTTPCAASSPSPAATAALGNVVNVGSGREIAIGDAGGAADRDHGTRCDGRRRRGDRLRPAGSEVERLLADTTRAREWAGWQPEVSFEEGLRRTSEWVRDNLALVDPTRYQV